jgi:hypothetical protein
MDAESSKDVEMLHRIEWKEVKKYITERKNEFAR